MATRNAVTLDRAAGHLNPPLTRAEGTVPFKGRSTRAKENQPAARGDREGCRQTNCPGEK